MLIGFRVLDLTDEKGYLCGKILGDLGADVIKIEKPGGDSGRDVGPFYHDVPDPQKSLYWFAFNTNKRGVTLDIQTSDGKAMFKKMVESADCVVESFPVDYMDDLGLGYSELSAMNRQLIMASITPFGRQGPYREYKASDLVLQALGGMAYITGDRDRPPVRVGSPHSFQAFQNGAADAAVAIMMAYYDREMTREGQHIDISIQQSMFLNSAFYTIPFWEFFHVITGRHGPFRSGLGTGAVTRMIWPCKDGFINMTIMGGDVGAKRNRALVEWMDSEGMCPDFMKDMDWENFDMFRMTQELWDRLEGPLSDFFKLYTSEELYEGSVERNIMLYPLYNPEDLLAYEQLKARQFWVEVAHPELDESIIYPGAFAKSTEFDFPIRRRPPLIGEHNREIYVQELGYSIEDCQILKESKII